MCLAGMTVTHGELQLCDLPGLADRLENEARLMTLQDIWRIGLLLTAARALRAEHARRLNDPNVATWEN